MQKIKITVGLAIFFSLLILIQISGGHSLADQARSDQVKRISSPDADSAEPSMASDSNGNVFLIWVEHKESGEGDVFLQKLDKNKNLIGEKLRINPQSGKATAWRGDPPTIKVGDDNTIYVGWTARVETAEGTASDLYLSVSRNGGQSFETPVKVNDDMAPAVHGMHALAVDKNNNVYFSWLDERYLKRESDRQPEKSENKSNAKNTPVNHHMDANREVYFAASKDGGKSFGVNKRLTDNACPCCKVSILAAPDGRLYVSWRQVLPNNYRHIAITTSNDGGNNFAPVTIVSDDRWQLEGCPVSGASLATGSDQNLKVIWYSAGEAGQPGLYWAESKDHGKTFSPRSLIYEGVLTGTPVLLANGSEDFKIIWQSNGKIWQLSTQLVSNISDKPVEIGLGKMPSAAITNHELFVGFIQSESDKRAIWVF